MNSFTETLSPPKATPTGIEIDAPTLASTVDSKFSFASGRFRLIQVHFRDQTDSHAELVQESEWLLHTSEAELRLQGNVFVLENVLNGNGTIFVKLAPLPAARATSSEWDVCARKNGAFELGEADGYEWRITTYQGGKWNRIAAIHALQRKIRPYNPTQDGLLLTNTWGDRNRDAHLNPAFMEREIECAARLGADVVQIDDGWEQGLTANSSDSQGDGIWNMHLL